MPVTLKWHWRPPRFMRRATLVMVEGIPRGAVRGYAEAQRLELIDAGIAALVASMNVPDLMRTTACCEGHGGWGRLSSPYVAFEAPVELAALLHESLQADLMQPTPRLKFDWSIAGRFGRHQHMVFRLAIEGIDRYRWVNRRRLDADIHAVQEMVLDVLSKYVGPVSV